MEIMRGFAVVAKLVEAVPEIVPGILKAVDVVRHKSFCVFHRCDRMLVASACDLTVRRWKTDGSSIVFHTEEKRVADRVLPVVTAERLTRGQFQWGFGNSLAAVSGSCRAFVLADVAGIHAGVWCFGVIVEIPTSLLRICGLTCWERGNLAFFGGSRSRCGFWGRVILGGRGR